MAEVEALSHSGAAGQGLLSSSIAGHGGFASGALQASVGLSSPAPAAAPVAASPAGDAAGDLLATTLGDDPAAELPCWATFDHGGGLREVAVAKAVEEYFSYHHLEDCLQAFRRDVERAGLKHAPSRGCVAIVRDVEDVLVDFDAGRRQEFSEAWERIMPEEFRRSRDGRSLELRLQVHFATLRARAAIAAGGEPAPAELQEDLEPFRAFLSERGMDEVCADEGLIHLFALPFAQRPHLQPRLREIFLDDWLRELRRDIEAALRAQQPALPHIYGVLDPPSSAPAAGDWQAVWADLLRVADYSLDAVGMLAHGIHVNRAAIGEGQRQLERLREQVPGGMEIKLRSSISHSSASRGASPSRARGAAAMPPQMPADIDFGRVRAFICSEEGAPAPHLSRETVLRAVLQRLASPESPVSQRRGFLASLVCFDALGARSSPRALSNLLAEASLTGLTLGILAVFACEAVGRTYVVQNLACVEQVVLLLKAQPLDSSMHTQALAALQRLSLRRAPQDRMIALGLVEWVVGLLGWQGESIQGMPSEFSLEFGSALLMNLALRTEGKRRCMKVDTLTVALNLMEHWNPQIRTHINGTLYSLLSEPQFRALARRAGLDSVLRSMHSHAASLCDDIARKQMEYLLEQLNLVGKEGEKPSGEAGDGNESGEDDEDDDENFLEEEELAGLLLGDRCGHAADEALRHFWANEAVVEEQRRLIRGFLNTQNLPGASAAR